MVIKFSVTRLVARTRIHTNTHTRRHTQTHTCTAWLCRVLGRESLRLCLSEAHSKVSNDSHLQRPVTSSHLSFSHPSLYSVHLSLSASLPLPLCFHLFWPLYWLLYSLHPLFPSFFLIHCLSLLHFLRSSLCSPPVFRKMSFSSALTTSTECFFKPKRVCIYVCLCLCVRAICPQSQWKHSFPSTSGDRLCISLLFPALGFFFFLLPSRVLSSPLKVSWKIAFSPMCPHQCTIALLCVRPSAPVHLCIILTVW